MYPPIAIANHFIRLATEQGVKDLSSRKLQDLLYCAHGWSLGITRQPLLADEVLAGEAGPYIAAVAEVAEGYGTRHISDELPAIQLGDRDDAPVQSAPPRLAAGAPVERILGITWKAFGQLSAFELSRIVKAAGGPWDQIWNRPEREGRDPTPIELARIQRWFMELAEKNRRRTQAKTVQDTQRIASEFIDTKQLRPV